MKKSLVFALSIVGTFIGAGFATGQEILSFFILKSGYSSYLYVLSCFLINFVCFKAYRSARRIKVREANTLYKRIYGSMFGGIMAVVSALALFVGYGATVAGMGSFFSERLGLPYAAGAALMFAAAWTVSKIGIKGIYVMNVFLTPVMILAALVTGIAAASDTAVCFAFKSGEVTAWWYALLYAGCNIFSLVPVSVAESDKIPEKTALRGFVISFLITAVSGCAAIAALNSDIGISLRSMLPLPAVAASVSDSLDKIYSAVIGFSLITTGTSCLFGFVSGIGERIIPKKPAVFFICGAGTLIFAFTGFLNIVRVLYPAIGFFGTFLLLKTLFYGNEP